MKSEDYHGQMTADNIKKWIKEKVTPNLPSASVILMENVFYHGKQTDKTLSFSSVNKDITNWLRQNGVEHDNIMRKAVLYLLTLKGRKGMYISRTCKCDWPNWRLLSRYIMTLLKGLYTWKIRHFCI
jgi:hypothetical protein